MALKREHSSDDNESAPQAKQVKAENGTRVSALIPVHPRKSAVVGQRDESLLRMLCKDTKTGSEKELHFRKIVHSHIDWNKSADIQKINQWRNQIYGRAGIKAKDVILWHQDEELWIELNYHLLIAEALKHGLMIPKAKEILAKFNPFFEGKVFQDRYGNDLPPRVARKENAFQSKLNRMCKALRERLETVAFGKSGDVFVPDITERMLKAYKELKQELDLGVESWYSEDLQKWLGFFMNLPEPTDQEMKDIESAKNVLVDINNGQDVKRAKKPNVAVAPATNVAGIGPTKEARFGMNANAARSPPGSPARNNPFDFDDENKENIPPLGHVTPPPPEHMTPRSHSSVSSPPSFASTVNDLHDASFQTVATEPMTDERHAASVSEAEASAAEALVGMMTGASYGSQSGASE